MEEIDHQTYSYTFFNTYVEKVKSLTPGESVSTKELLFKTFPEPYPLDNHLVEWTKTAEGVAVLKERPCIINSLIEDLVTCNNIKQVDSRLAMKTIFRRDLFAPNLVEQKLIYMPVNPYEIKAAKVLNDKGRTITTEFLLEIYKNSKQSNKVKEQTNKIVKCFLEKLLSAKLGNLGVNDLRLAVFGSACNSFAMNTSDIDATLLTESFFPERTLINFINEKLVDLGPSNFSFEVNDRKDLRFPLLKVKYQSGELSNTLDISVNNVLGVINSELLSVYAKIDPRCEQMGILLKEWGKRQRVVNKYALSSYSMILLLVYFLQIKKILPSVQRISKEMKKGEELEWIDVRRVERYDQVVKFKTRATFETDIEVIKSYMKAKGFIPNTQNMFELLTEFFEFYSSGGIFRKYRLRCNIKRGEVDFVNINNSLENELLFSIKDPLDKCHNPGAKVCKVSDFKTPEEIQMNFNNAATNLRGNKFNEVFQARK